ncbi:MAG: O-succinylhomoserine sulfhydrylase [Pseudomonadota bacterium]|nr:O-succinylhomoserine sulfhydrylase [Pseudomonadota bacterium]
MEQSEPIFATSSFVFANAAQAAARFSGQEPGNIYSRFTNPTVRVFEERLAAMEGGERCVGTASGMGAILSTCLALLKHGDHIVSSRAIFGTTVGLFNNLLSKFGVLTSFVPLADYAAWEAAIRPETRILFLETPSNPLTDIADIERLAGIAHRHGTLLVVDNCFCTPALQLPLSLGADLIIHSGTKYLDGQGRCVGGAIIGTKAVVGEAVFNCLRSGGASMSPFNAWVFLKGLETLGLRMRAHCEHAMKVAAHLERHPRVSRVYYAGLSSHPQHALARRQQRGFGGIVSFDVPGGREEAWRVIDRVRIFSITANLGDAKSTITHPATTTHGRLSVEERAEAGIGESLIRLSVGLEDPDDLCRDLDRALDAA